MNQKDLELFPYNMVQHNIDFEEETTTQLLTHLKEGSSYQDNARYGDWVLLLVLFSSYAYVMIRSFFGKYPRDVVKYLTTRTSSESSSGDLSSLMSGKSFLIHFVSYLNLALFGYIMACYYKLIPEGVSGPLALVVIFGLLLLMLVFRQLICLFTGFISGNTKLFKEYIISLTNAYKFLAIILFIISILIIYTHFVSTKVLLIISYIVIGFVFLVRYTRLFLSFRETNLSIFYLILYLCALEILPIAIFIKYMHEML